MHKAFVIFVLVMYLLIFLVGLINLINPRWMWNKFESWKAVKEPSKAFFVLRRISGLVIMLIITSIAMFPHIMSVINP